ncbi:uncharacterized protein LOC141847752 isoform X2 [Curcuma longa]|uniref:uncharacterized protein LOC141847752 isoform X2 n=1 Tax=Curcuma longa TaxID=136217 RepID=UPI003D9E344B
MKQWTNQHHCHLKFQKPRRKIGHQQKRKLTLSASVPRSLRMLYCYSMRALQDDKFILVVLEHDVFDDDYELILHLEDIVPMYQLEELSANCVVAYICCHWILTVIEPYTEIVYVLDSLSHRMRYEDWKYIVEMALRLFNSNKGRKGRKKPVWEILQAPRQPDGKQCGYYVMRFMRQIIAEIETIERDGLRSIFKAAEYTRAEIDEVRSEVADCIQDHIYE